MKSTWGIYVEQQAGTLELYEGGHYLRELPEPRDLLLVLTRHLESAMMVIRSAWAVHLVAWAGELEAPEKIVGDPRGDTHVEISLRDGKGVQVPVEHGLIRLHTPAKVEHCEGCGNDDGPSWCKGVPQASVL